ncbi:DUF4221 family protein [Algoriphagus yeomjeoni]|uniref:DUF4221 family protein n=1 Tax=Algoriphagus yeomjeoni TaxID=291403 RepID=UPI003CE511C3
MKKLSYLLAVLAFASCSSEKETQEEPTKNVEISYSIDTVLVDAKDEFLFLNWRLGISDVDTESKLLYNLNPESLRLEVIDLEKLELKELVQLEKEGPNGVGGGFVIGLDKPSNGNLFLFDVTGIFQLSPDFTKIKKILFEGENLSNQGLPAEAMIDIDAAISEEGNLIASLYQEVGAKGNYLGLALLNVDTEELSLHPTDFLQYLKDLEIYMVQDGRTRMSFPEQHKMQFHANKLIINTSAKNEVWMYDLDTDSLTNKVYESKLTSNAKSGNYERTTESMERFQEEGKKKSSEVAFNPLMHDPARKVFWRTTIEGKTKVLTVFDQDLNMLGETQIEEELEIGNNTFFLDGAIYQFLNIDDEMAFVRLKPTFD